MKTFVETCWTLVVLAALCIAAWVLGMDRVVHTSIAAGHLLDWVMGAFCLVWLLVILKIPWDLYFQAHTVAFEIQRSEERKIELPAGRAEYIQKLRKNLCWLAVGAHLGSALLITAIAHFTGGVVGYYFAVFYLVSTVFRPAVAAYVYLTRKLAAIGEEARYPREDVVEIREKLKWQEITLRDLTDRITDLQGALDQERRQRSEENGQLALQRETEYKQLRQSVHAISREFETTASRLTDNQEVIKGIQAFVRLISQSTQPGG